MSVIAIEKLESALWPAVTAREWQSTARQKDWPQAPESGGHPAFLIPGFLAGDPSLRRMAVWLRSNGWDTTRSGLDFNVDCMERSMAGLEAALEGAVDRAGAKALVIGQSRGGVFARALAVRRPELVDEVITLGSPLVNQFGVHPYVLPSVALVGFLGTLGVPGLFTADCAFGPCCAPARQDMSAPLPDSMRLLSLYSKRDEIVQWTACLDPDAIQLEVSSTHLGMGVNARVWEAIQRFLDEASPAALAA